MSIRRLKAKYMWPLLLPVIFHVTAFAGSWAADDPVAFLPPLSCSARWKIEGKPLFYSRETLSDRINGEAELYFPYGFDRMGAARYVSDKNATTGIDVEIYRMGSLLDAFGMYANYRQKDGKEINAGAESNLSSSQLIFYQDRYFIHIQLTGGDTAGAEEALIKCGRDVAARLPGPKSQPPELSIVDRSEVMKGTERYLPQSLLGYDFLNKGVIADAAIPGVHFQMFVLLNTTQQSATIVFDRFRSQVTQGKVDVKGSGITFLEGVDPLYGPVIVVKKGNCFAGVLKFSADKGLRPFLESLCK